MDILIAHWHCILPAALLILAVAVLQWKDSAKSKREKRDMGDDGYGEE